MLISVVSPVYKAEKIVPELVKRIIESVSLITEDFEIILVEDCGPDNSWNAIEKQCSINGRVKGIKLSRNFGQHYAITAGINYAKGEWVVVMDCDLQDRPEEIPALYAKALEGFEVVQARRVERQDTFFKRLTSKGFYFTLSYLTGVKYDATIANFGIFHSKVIDAVVSLNERIKYFPSMVRWVGFRKTAIDVVHADREEGASSYNIKRLINLALDIILSNSDKPIRLAVKFGLIVSATAILSAIIYVIRALKGDFQQIGYASIIISIWFFSGIIISILGVVGLYVGKTFEEGKGRPAYIVHKSMNL